jgi:hypothetical protein
MNTQPLTPALRGYPIDKDLVRANRAQRRPRRRRNRFAALRDLAARRRQR